MLPYTRTDIHFRIAVKDGAATFENILRGDAYTARVSMENVTVIVEDIAYNGTTALYADGLPALWMNTLDYSMDVTCTENPTAAVTWDGKAIRLDTHGKDGVYRIHISI